MSWLSELIRRMKPSGQSLMDSYKPAAREQVDKLTMQLVAAVDTEGAGAEQVRALVATFTDAALKSVSIPALARELLKVALADYSLKALSGHGAKLKVNIRAEGERVKKKIDGARL